MFKGIVFALLLPLLVACGGGGGGPGGTSNDRESEDVDPYLGSWERQCTPIDDYYPSSLIEQLEFDFGSLFTLYWTEKLTIEKDRVVLSWAFYDDDKCEGGTALAPLIELLGWDNIGGEILERTEVVSSGGWPVVLYQADDGITGPILYLNLHNVDDRLYKAEITGSLVGGLSGDDVTVNFNKYYTRVTR